MQLLNARINRRSSSHIFKTDRIRGPARKMHIKAIVYNKTRKYAGHTVDLNLGDNATVAEAKSKIEEITTVPSQIQWIVFGTTHLEDSKPLREYGIRDGYTIYSTPTYVEIQDMPNL